MPVLYLLLRVTYDRSRNINFGRSLHKDNVWMTLTFHKCIKRGEIKKKMTSGPSHFFCLYQQWSFWWSNFCFSEFSIFNRKSGASAGCWLPLFEAKSWSDECKNKYPQLLEIVFKKTVQLLSQIEGHSQKNKPSFLDFAQMIPTLFVLRLMS